MCNRKTKNGFLRKYSTNNIISYKDEKFTIEDKKEYIEKNKIFKFVIR